MLKSLNCYDFDFRSRDCGSKRCMNLQTCTKCFYNSPTYRKLLNAYRINNKH